MRSGSGPALGHKGEMAALRKRSARQKTGLRRQDMGRRNGSQSRMWMGCGSMAWRCANYDAFVVRKKLLLRKYCVLFLVEQTAALYDLYT